MKKLKPAVIPSNPPATGASVRSDPSQIDFDQLLTREQVAKLLQVSKSYIDEKTRRRCPNPIPCIRMGKFTRFYKPHVSDWLLRQSTHTGRAA